jgi:formimidoylglutamate deiminase
MATGVSAQVFHCPWLLSAVGWLQDGLLTVGADGMIVDIESGDIPSGAMRLKGPVIPGMCNVHSHAHQRLIAGLTGRKGPTHDSFWSWREQMYAAIAMLSADDLELLAGWLYMELLEGGYTSIGEFHYPHRLQGCDPDQSSQALLDAAKRAGCALTLLPVWYRYSNFGRVPASALQRPFVMDATAFTELVGKLGRSTDESALIRIGMAPHSLRAVDVADLAGLAAEIPDGPIHIHIAEQPAEVEACVAHSGQPPITVLAGQAELDQRWCLIHATHANDEEIRLMAESGVVVGLCPTTEADLGDGLFPVRQLLDYGGRLAIGSDSNLCTSAAAELRLLEWGQRLKLHQRNVLVPGEGGHLGRYLWQHAAAAGAQALAQPAGALNPGLRADFVVLNGDHPLLSGLAPDAQLDTLIMAEQAGMISEVYVSGQQRVSGGLHPGRPALAGRIAELRQRLSLRTQ